MHSMTGRRVFSRKPSRSLHFWLGSLFLIVVSLPAILIIMRHGYRISSESFQWLLLGIAAVWLFWIRAWIAHARLHTYVTRIGSNADGIDFVLEQAFQLVYIGLTLMGFATLGFLIVLWRVIGGR